MMTPVQYRIMKDWETDKHRWPVSSWNSKVPQLSVVERTESTVGITEVEETALLQLLCSPVSTTQCTALLHTPGVNRENRSMLLSRPLYTNPSYLPRFPCPWSLSDVVVRSTRLIGDWCQG